MRSLKYQGLASVESKSKRAAPRIVFLQPQPCIRALKYARGIKWAFGGHINIMLGYLYHTLNELYGNGDEVFLKLVKLNPGNLEGDIKTLVNRFHPFIIHSHNAPDFLTIAAIEAVGDEVPIIHDCHEALTLRETGYYTGDDKETIRNRYPRQEKIANERSDGRIYATEGVKDYIQKRYDVDSAKDIVLYSYLCKSMLPPRFCRKLSDKDGEKHIVYVGTATSKIKDSHYDLREIFKEISKHGIHIHLYLSIWGAKDKAYQHLAEENDFIHYHGHLDQNKLLYEITRYDFGWAGFNGNQKNRKHLDVALPNKVFEYIACGLPVLAFPHKNLRKFLDRHHVGLVFDCIDDMAAQIKNRNVEGIRRNALKLKDNFTVEENIHKLIRYYEEISASKPS
ncbi:MAG: glycosyltransferase [Nitrososphaerales archaeon]